MLFTPRLSGVVVRLLTLPCGTRLWQLQHFRSGWPLAPFVSYNLLLAVIWETSSLWQRMQLACILFLALSLALMFCPLGAKSHGSRVLESIPGLCKNLVSKGLLWQMTIDAVCSIPVRAVLPGCKLCIHGMAVDAYFRIFWKIWEHVGCISHISKHSHCCQNRKNWNIFHDIFCFHTWPLKYPDFWGTLKFPFSSFTANAMPKN